MRDRAEKVPPRPMLLSLVPRRIVVPVGHPLGPGKEFLAEDLLHHRSRTAAGKDVVGIVDNMNTAPISQLPDGCSRFQFQEGDSRFTLRKHECHPYTTGDTPGDMHGSLLRRAR